MSLSQELMNHSWEFFTRTTLSNTAVLIDKTVVGLDILSTMLWSVVLLVFRHIFIAKSSVVQEERLGYSTLIGGKAPLAARDSGEVARCYPHTGNGWHMSSSLSFSVGYSAIDVADVISLLS